MSKSEFERKLEELKDSCDDCPLHKNPEIHCKYVCGNWGCYTMMQKHKLIHKEEKI